MLESYSYTLQKKQKYKQHSFFTSDLFFPLKKKIIKGANLFYDQLKLTYQEHNPTWIHKIKMVMWISI